MAFRTVLVSFSGELQAEAGPVFPFCSWAAPVGSEAAVRPPNPAACCASWGFMVPLRLFLDVKSVLEKYLQIFLVLMQERSSWAQTVVLLIFQAVAILLSAVPRHPHHFMFPL